ncbi:acyl-CoA dehydrogenase family protein [Pigmentiphaga soli]|uniref:Acyl-CoA dehydrogenase family protein n=1 Tax=Pigmentiphaga soli TaxID=1007095 RepID=A0ABP8H9N0_9BURK
MTAARFEFTPPVFPGHIESLREEVRAFLAEERASGALPRPNYVSMLVSLPFTKKLAERGWIGMTWPAEYGGHERTALERYAVTEELLAACAPIRAHWVADRQSAAVLLRFGTEEQKRKYLPRIAAGDWFFTPGLSEPDAGSDLASLRTSATKVEGGWRVQGTKIWNSNSHVAQYTLLLCRTEPAGEDRHHGLSRFIVDLSSPGIQIRPIINLAGEHDFNQLYFDDVFVPDENVVGELGNGWNQATTELAYERSGPERWMSSFRLLAELTEALGEDASPSACRELGALLAEMLALRQMSMSIAVMLEQGRAPNQEAAIVKDLGTCFEQAMVAKARDLIHEEGIELHGGARRLGEVLDNAQAWSICYTIRGGAKEIMRGVIARGLGLR